MNHKEFEALVQGGYQAMSKNMPALEHDKKGYQPTAEKPSNPQPPNLGPATVTPSTGTPSNNKPQSGSTGSGKAQDE